MFTAYTLSFKGVWSEWSYWCANTRISCNELQNGELGLPQYSSVNISISKKTLSKNSRKHFKMSNAIV